MKASPCLSVLHLCKSSNNQTVAVGWVYGSFEPSKLFQDFVKPCNSRSNAMGASMGQKALDPFQNVGTCIFILKKRNILLTNGNYLHTSQVGFKAIDSNYIYHVYTLRMIYHINESSFYSGLSVIREGETMYWHLHDCPPKCVPPSHSSFCSRVAVS